MLETGITSNLTILSWVQGTKYLDSHCNLPLGNLKLISMPTVVVQLPYTCLANVSSNNKSHNLPIKLARLICPSQIMLHKHLMASWEAKTLQGSPKTTRLVLSSSPHSLPYHHMPLTICRAGVQNCCPYSCLISLILLPGADTLHVYSCQVLDISFLPS